jgi:hypothetical protein
MSGNNRRMDKSMILTNGDLDAIRALKLDLAHVEGVGVERFGYCEVRRTVWPLK